MADDADLRTTISKAALAEKIPLVASDVKALAVDRDPRLPMPGTVLTRTYKRNPLQIKVLHQGFEIAGHLYPSLTAVAKAITGSHCNGFLFFGLVQKGRQP